MQRAGNSSTTDHACLVYLTYNSESDVRRNLPLLARSGGEPFGICAVDNASTDNTVACLHDMGICPLLNTENIGYSAAINQGVEWALHGDAEWILLVNPDVRPRVNRWVRKLLDVPPECGIVGARLVRHGMVVHGGGTVTRNAYPFQSQRGYEFGRKVLWAREVLGMSRTSHRTGFHSQYTRPGEVPWVTFAVAAIRRRVFETIGFLNEDYYLYSSDTEFCLRALTRGFRVWYNPVEFEHEGGGSLRHAPQEVQLRAQQDLMMWLREQHQWLERVGFGHPHGAL